MMTPSTRPQHPVTRHCLAGAVAACLLAAPLTQAGTATLESGEGDRISFEYDGNLLRINTESPEAYVVVRDGTMYVVNIGGEQPMVFNASSMMKGLAQNAIQFAPEDLRNEFESLEDTGRDETVAGITGDVYVFTFIDEDGQRQSEEMVLSDDPRAREFRDALFSMVAVAGDFAGEQSTEETEKVMGQLSALNAGMLRVGEDMRVASISGDRIPAERFALPAEPMDMSGLGSMLGAAMSQQPAEDGDTQGQQNGGLLGGMLGAFGKKSDDAADAAEGETEEKEKKNPFKAFGKKLFGDD